METIQIDGKTYRLVPVEDFDSKDMSALAKAESLIEKYVDYRQVPVKVLASRILKIDAMSKEEYVDYYLETWLDWDNIYEMLDYVKYNPHKNMDDLKRFVKNMVKDALKKKSSISSGFFFIKYYGNDKTEDGSEELQIYFSPVEMIVNIKDGDRDYLKPGDDKEEQ